MRCDWDGGKASQLHKKQEEGERVAGEGRVGGEEDEAELDTEVVVGKVKL